MLIQVVTAVLLLPFAFTVLLTHMDERLAARVAARISALLGQHYGAQRTVARHCKKSDGWLSNIVNGRASVRLDDLESIAEALGVSVADLVDDQPRADMRLNLTEQDIIGMYRKMPEKIQKRWMDFLTWAVYHK